MTQWREVKYLKILEDGPESEHVWKYKFVLPEPLASWDVFAVWEKERIFDMQSKLKKGMVLFDVGAEHGWLSLAYADMVGAENIVLMEPTRKFWPNIYQTWARNYHNQKPKAFYDGLVSNQTTDKRKTSFTDWPSAINGEMIDRNSYTYIHDNPDDLPEMTIDDYINKTGIVPDALTIDVEGAEYLVLQGAINTLKKHRPLIWLSVHPDLMLRDYGTMDSELFMYMTDLGYENKWLATDHEEHHFLYAKGK